MLCLVIGSAGYIHITLKSSELLVSSKSCQAAKLSLQPEFGLQNFGPTEEPEFALDSAKSVSLVMRNIVHINNVSRTIMDSPTLDTCKIDLDRVLGHLV